MQLPNVGDFATKILRLSGITIELRDTINTHNTGTVCLGVYRSIIYISSSPSFLPLLSLSHSSPYPTPVLIPPLIFLPLSSLIPLCPLSLSLPLSHSVPYPFLLPYPTPPLIPLSSPPLSPSPLCVLPFTPLLLLSVS